MLGTSGVVAKALETKDMRVPSLISSVALAALVAAGIMTLSAPGAKADTFTLDFTTGNNAGEFNPTGPSGDFTVDLTITTSGPAFSRYGFSDGQVITGVSGTVTGVGPTVYSASVATGYTGLWAPDASLGNQFQVTSGLYTNGAAPGIFTDHGIFNSGGADFIVDNAWFPTSATGIDNDGGIGLLLDNGASVLIFSNCNPSPGGGSCGYWLGITASPATGGPLASAPAETPIPAALPLFGSGLAALGALVWRRKRKTSAASAA
jgi:hypothetical protein